MNLTSTFDFTSSASFTVPPKNGDLEWHIDKEIHFLLPKAMLPLTYRDTQFNSNYSNSDVARHRHYALKHNCILKTLERVYLVHKVGEGPISLTGILNSPQDMILWNYSLHKTDEAMEATTVHQLTHGHNTQERRTIVIVHVHSDLSKSSSLDLE